MKLHNYTNSIELYVKIMNDFRFSLEKYSGMKTRYFCPNCSKRTFTRYIDNHANKHVGEDVGKCNREEKCAYHYTPKMYFDKTGTIAELINKPILKVEKERKKASLIDKDYFQSTLGGYLSNNFALGLCQIFSKSEVFKVLKKYYVGTELNGAAIFWQRNRKGEVRTGKIIQYDQHALKRNSKIKWVHSKKHDFELKQVFFGAHLLSYTTPIAIAEGEKNAIFGALFYPQYCWLASGAKNNLNQTKLNAFKKFNVTLFPDKGKAFELWTKFAQNATFNVKVNSVIENCQLPDGSDIADLIIEIKKTQFSRSPNGITERLIKMNPNLRRMIDTFDLKHI